MSNRYDPDLIDRAIITVLSVIGIGICWLIIALGALRLLGTW